MNSFLDLLKRYIPPYKGWVGANVAFNLLGAIFGAFSFAALSPALGILFRTQELVLEKKPFSFSIESIKNHLYYYLSAVIERAGEFKALFYVGVFLMVMVFFKVGFTYLASFSMVPIRNGVVHDIRKNMFRKITQLPVGYFNNERKGDIISRITGDVQEVEASVMNSLEMLFKNPVLIIISLLVMFYMSWSLTIFVLIMMPVALLIIGRIGRSLKKTSGLGQAKMGEVLSTIEESISGLTVIKAFNAEESVQKRFGVQIKAYFQIMNRLMWRRFLAHPVSEFLGTTIMVVVLWYGGRLILSDGGSLKAQDFITYLIFFYSIINPSKALSTAYYSVQKGLASMDRIDELLNAPNPLKESENASAIHHFNHSLEFVNVSFSYEDKVILKNINLTIKKGEKVALVGQSGSGKTTLVNLIPRFWDVQSGEVRVDGVNLKDLKVKDLRSLIGFVNQDPVLFNGTFIENIAIEGGTVSRDAIEKAAKVANAFEFISKSENGFYTNVGDRGAKLSGGQRQRISIARAVLKNPPILILDEATSSLDTESEKFVQEALEKLMEKRTSLVVAHRLSTILNADKIVVMQDGQIVEQGAHNELLSQKGIYEKLFNMQFS